MWLSQPVATDSRTNLSFQLSTSKTHKPTCTFVDYIVDASWRLAAMKQDFEALRTLWQQENTTTCSLETERTMASAREPASILLVSTWNNTQRLSMAKHKLSSRSTVMSMTSWPHCHRPFMQAHRRGFPKREPFGKRYRQRGLTEESSRVERQIRSYNSVELWCVKQGSATISKQRPRRGYRNCFSYRRS